ncbi:MAG: electron transport complex subunit RsxC [Gammaproteobacteria bacterium]
MTAKPRQLWHFHGGLKLDGKKHLSRDKGIVSSLLPKQLVIPVHQHIGESGDLIVAKGDRVLKGQTLAQPNGYVSAPIHAPSSGTIIDIAEYPAPHPSQLSTLSVVIETDGKDEWLELEPVPDFKTLEPAEIRNLIRQAGIVGLGGAAFPTAVKLNPGPGHQIDTLIINGAECEPYITCDDRLMRERPEQVISGVEIILHAIQAQRCLIAIEDNKPEAIAALNHTLAELKQPNIHVVGIPTLYPVGGEKQLIKVLTNKEVPTNGLPVDIGIVVQNLGTTVAINRAIHLGEPLISRIVTVSGEGIQQSQNMEVLIGTSIADLVEQCGGYTESAERLVMGGPMMGFSLHKDQLPIIKGCNCILAIEADATAGNNHMPCIRCGECTRVCPANLLPQQLYWHASAKNFDSVQDYHLFDCIECGCCAYVCPSHIPLVQYYRFAKTEIWHQEREKNKSDHARVRHDLRQQRLEREKQEREEKLRQKKELLAKKKQAEAAGTDKAIEEDPKKAAIAAALERVKAKKAESTSQPRNMENLTDDQQKQIDEAEQRRRALKKP